MKYINYCFFFLCFPYMVLSQSDVRTVHTLEECVEIALINNLDLKQSLLAEKTKEIHFKQNKNEILPSLNANYNLATSSGRSIDPYTNAFINENLTYSNVGLGLDATIFEGFKHRNRLKQAKLYLEAAEMETEAAKQSLILNVTLSYLQVLNLQDLVRLAEARINTTRGQLERLESMYEEEIGNPAEYRDLQGQIASDISNLAESKNRLELELINLNTLLNTQEEVTIASIGQNIIIDSYNYSAQEVYLQALEVLPSIKANDLYLKAADKAVAVARAQYAPEISLFANLHTNYSSAANFFKETGNSIVETGDFVTINNQEYQVFTEQTNFTNEKISYYSQLDNNLNSSIGVAVRIPIFNGFQTKNNVTLEKIRRMETQIVLEKAKLDLQQSVKQSYYMMQTAFERYSLLQEQVEAYKESFRINEIRFNSGLSNSVDYLMSKNNLDNAQINLSNIGYEYLLRVKILEYYRGGI